MNRQAADVQNTDKEIDEETRCALAVKTLAEQGKALAHLSRHESRIRRGMQHSIDELRAMQAERKQKCTDEPENLAA